ncbi:MAG: c-type cytochrome domain-containing protein [Kofleriaceae bacterium]
MTRATTCLIVLVASGCLDAIAPDVGPLAATSSDGAVGCVNDSNTDLAISFEVDILEGVFVRGDCIDCHTNDGVGRRQSGLDLDSYTTLRTGGGRSGPGIVVNGDPCTSVLVQKIAASPPFGRRMPYNGPPYLTSTDQQIIHDWIGEGARDN